jgi:Alpha/beta hydrolase domain
MRRTAVIASLITVVATACSSNEHTALESSTTTAPPRAASAVVAVPTISGPISGGTPDIPMNAMTASYKPTYDYSEHEYFIAGNASAYEPVGALGVDGKWNAAKASTAPYKTRILVRTPNDPKKFNGTVVVEWLNVTAGRDSDPDFGFAGTELLRDGFAYVGVTTQIGGVGGGGALTLPIPGYHPKPLITQNPARYQSLHHPGDDYAYDIFSQAAQSLVQRNGPSPLGTLRPQRLIATGESQSAFYMVTYVNAIQPRTKMFDGFMIHSRGGSGSPLQAKGSAPMPAEARIRTDLGVPVMTIATETDLFGLGFYPARQPDTDLIRTWEMAGTSHADQSTLDYGITSGRQWDRTSKVPDFTSMCGSINNGPQRYILRRAFAALNAWVTTGTAPAHSPRLEVRAGKIVRDARGNAVGGIRTPAVDAPTEVVSGESPSGRSVICSLFGTAEPFSAATLQSLYPTHADYVAKVKQSAARAVAAGFLLQPDANEIVQTAEAAKVP